MATDHKAIAEQYNAQLKRKQDNDRRAIQLNTVLTQRQEDHRQASAKALELFGTNDVEQLGKLLREQTSANLAAIEEIKQGEDKREKEMADLGQLLGLA